MRDSASCRLALLAARALLTNAAGFKRLPKASRARHAAAADALLLWAHTRTFATATAYEEVRGHHYYSYLL